MPVEKVSLSLEADVVAEARAESGGNLSAYVNEAVAARLRNRELRRVLDEFKHEFPPIDPEEEVRIERQFDEGLARIEAANRELDQIMVRGTSLLNDHPLVDEAIIGLGSLRTPVAYVVLTDERKTVSEAADILRGVIAQVAKTWRVDIVLAVKPPGAGRPRPVLPGIAPL
jgi:hypothetical protein